MCIFLFFLYLNLYYGVENNSFIRCITQDIHSIHKIQFNSINLRNLADLRIVRTICQRGTVTVSLAIYVPTKKYVVLESKEALIPFAENDCSKQAKIIRELGPIEGLITYYGYSQLDGRAYALYKYYEMGSLQQQLIRYKQNQLCFSEEAIWSFMLQIANTVGQVLSNNLYPKLDPNSIYLEEKVQLGYPEMDYVDESSITRKARILLVVSDIKPIKQITAVNNTDQFKVSISPSVTLADQLFTHSGRKSCIDVDKKLLQSVKEMDDSNIFNPKTEPISVQKRPNTAHVHREQQLKKIYAVEGIPTMLNAQNVDEKLFNQQLKLFRVYQPEKDSNSLVCEQIASLLNLFMSLSNGMARIPDEYIDEYNNSCNQLQTEVESKTVVNLNSPFRSRLRSAQIYQQKSATRTSGVSFYSQVPQTPLTLHTMRQKIQKQDQFYTDYLMSLKQQCESKTAKFSDIRSYILSYTSRFQQHAVQTFQELLNSRQFTQNNHQSPSTRTYSAVIGRELQQVRKAIKITELEKVILPQQQLQKSPTKNHSTIGNLENVENQTVKMQSSEIRKIEWGVSCKENEELVEKKQKQLRLQREADKLRYMGQKPQQVAITPPKQQMMRFKGLFTE